MELFIFIVATIAAILAVPPALKALRDLRGPGGGALGRTIQKLWKPVKKMRARPKEEDRPSASAAPFRTRFPKGEYDDAWRWIDPKGDCRIEALTPAGLRVHVPSPDHDLWPGSNFNAPRFLRLTAGQFVVTAHIRCTPNTHVQGAALPLWKSERNFWELRRVLHHPGHPNYSQLVQLEGSSDGNYVVVPGRRCLSTDLYLRLRYSNQAVRALYSVDARRWTQVGTAPFYPGSEMMAGFVVINQWGANSPSFFADLLLFEVAPLL